MNSNIKKALLLTFVFGTFFSFASCDNFGQEDTTIDFVIQDQNFRFTFKPDTITASAFRAGVRSVGSINFAGLVQQHNVQVADIITATPAIVRLEISFPVAEEVDIFSNLEFGFINGTEEVLIGSVDTFPQGTDEVQLIANATRDITAFMAGQEISAYLSIETLEALDPEVEYDFTVSATIQLQAETVTN